MVIHHERSHKSKSCTDVNLFRGFIVHCESEEWLKRRLMWRTEDFQKEFLAKWTLAKESWECHTCHEFKLDSIKSDGDNYVQCPELKCQTWHHTKCYEITTQKEIDNFICLSCMTTDPSSGQRYSLD